MSKEKTIILKGLSRNQYDFDVYRWGVPFSTLSAVYIVLKRVAPGYSIIYIGHSHDMSRCMNNHEMRDCLEREGATHIGIMPQPTVSKRMATETDLIASYAPVCNNIVIEEEREEYLVFGQHVLVNPEQAFVADASHWHAP